MPKKSTIEDLKKFEDKYNVEILDKQNYENNTTLLTIKCLKCNQTLSEKRSIKSFLIIKSYCCQFNVNCFKFKNTSEEELLDLQYKFRSNLEKQKFMPPKKSKIEIEKEEINDILVQRKYTCHNLESYSDTKETKLFLSCNVCENIWNATLYGFRRNQGYCANCKYKLEKYLELCTKLKEITKKEFTNFTTEYEYNLYCYNDELKINFIILGRYKGKCGISFDEYPEYEKKFLYNMKKISDKCIENGIKVINLFDSDIDNEVLLSKKINECINENIINDNRRKIKYEDNDDIKEALNVDKYILKASKNSILNLVCSKGHEFYYKKEEYLKGSKCKTCKSEENKEDVEEENIKKNLHHNIIKTCKINDIEIVKIYDDIRYYDIECLKCGILHTFMKLRRFCNYNNNRVCCLKGVPMKSSKNKENSTERDKQVNFNHITEKINKICKDKNGECLNINDYINNKTKLKWKCNYCENNWEATYCNVVDHNSWCIKCSYRGSSEETCRFIIEYLFKEKFIKIRPEWLKNDKGNILELDCYNEDLKIALEYNGSQHYNYDPYLHRDYRGKDGIDIFSETLVNDKNKIKKCEDNGIKLIIVSYKEFNKGIVFLKNKIYKECEYKLNELKIDVDKEWLNTTNLEFKNKQNLIRKQRFLEECESRGYRFKNPDTEVVSLNKHKITLICPNNHEWDTTYDNLKHRGRNCAACSLEKRKEKNNL